MRNFFIPGILALEYLSLNLVAIMHVAFVSLGNKFGVPSTIIIIIIIIIIMIMVITIIIDITTYSKRLTPALFFRLCSQCE